MFFSKRELVKGAVQLAHHTALVTVSTVAIQAVVKPEEDSITESATELGGFALGTAIWWKTNGAVQRGIDRIADRRHHRKLETIVETAA